MNAAAAAQPSTVRRILGALGIVTLLLAIFVIFSPSTPAYAECKPEGVPDYAGSGVLGMIDPPPGDRIIQDGNYFIEVPPYNGLNNYNSYGWSGLLWHTCDIAGDFNIPDVMALIDTWIGNGLNGLAVGEAAVLTALHSWTLDPAPILRPIDDRLAELSAISVDLVFGQWAVALIIFAAAMVLVAAMTKNVRTALMTSLAVLGSLAFVSFVSSGPLTVARSMDGVAGQIIGSVDSAALQYAQVPTERDPEDACSFAAEEWESATAVLYNEGILQPMWRLGQTGTTECYPTTTAMFQASTASWQEVNEGYKVDDKRNAYNDAVEDVKNDEQLATQYQIIKGQGYNRAGAGAISLLMMTTIFLIRGPAEAYIFLGLLVIRFIPILGPIFAALAIPEQTRSAATGAMKIVAASVFNVIVFGVVAALHTVLTMKLYMDTTNIIATTLLSILLTYILMKLTKPYRSVTKLATGDRVAQELAEAPDAPGRAGKRALGFLTGTAVDFGRTGWQNMQDNKRHQKAEKAAEKRFERLEGGHYGPERARFGESVQTYYPPNWGTTQQGGGGAINPLWQEAPKLNPAWSQRPQETRPEPHDNDAPQTGIIDPGSLRQQPVVIRNEQDRSETPLTPPPFDPQMISTEPSERLDIPRPEVQRERVMMPESFSAPPANNSLSEPEFEAGRIVTNIFVPGSSPVTVDKPYTPERDVQNVIKPE